MRAKSKTVASKGLELACFVAERSEPFPDDAGAFAFEWESEDENEDDEKENDRMTSDGGWESGVRHDNENVRPGYDMKKKGKPPVCRMIRTRSLSIQSRRDSPGCVGPCVL